MGKRKIGHGLRITETEKALGSMVFQKKRQGEKCKIQEKRKSALAVCSANNVVERAFSCSRDINVLERSSSWCVANETNETK